MDRQLRPALGKTEADRILSVFDMKYDLLIFSSSRVAHFMCYM